MHMEPGKLFLENKCSLRKNTVFRNSSSSFLQRTKLGADSQRGRGIVGPLPGAGREARGSRRYPGKAGGVRESTAQTAGLLPRPRPRPKAPTAPGGAVPGLRVPSCYLHSESLLARGQTLSNTGQRSRLNVSPWGAGTGTDFTAPVPLLGPLPGVT